MREIILTVADDGGLKVKLNELTPFEAISLIEIAKYSLISNKNDIKEVIPDEV